MTTTNQADTDLGSVTISREFDAPRELIFSAFMDPAQFKYFWGPTGTSVPAESVVIEPRAGGRFEAVIVADDGSGRYPFVATFVEVVEAERFTFVVEGSTLLNTSTFDDLGDGRTRITIRQTNVPTEYRDPDGLAGFLTSLDRLAAHLDAVGPGSGRHGLPQVVAAGADGIRITREFAATPQAVFDAWTTPEHFAAWWGGADVVVPMESVSMDVRVGGLWKAQMVLPDATTIDWHGAFTVVDPPKHLAMTLADRAGDEYAPVTVTLTAIPGGTSMVMVQGGGQMDAAEYDRAGNGWGGFFDVMADIVSA